jgi:putative hemolysin
MLTLSRGRYQARPATTTEDVRRAQRLRWLAFRAAPDAGAGVDARGEAGCLDADGFDAACTHMLIEEAASGTLVCSFRLMDLPSGAVIGRSYAAQFYDLSALAGYAGRMVEMGRFCVHPAWRDADILRVAWAAMTAHVDATGVQMLFGCSSFRGTDAREYRDAFALLRARHLAPARWQPRVKAPSVVRFGGLQGGHPDPRRAMARMPPLLRTYLMMGGWVSDHAVVDRDLGTLHVFTGLEVGAVPPARARALRGISGASGPHGAPVPVRAPG